MSLQSDEAPTRRPLRQGIRVLHNRPYAEVDFLVVPGLGANPEECWTWRPSSAKTDRSSQDASSTCSGPFNWIRDSDGLASLFPKARIMLYDYASAWRGSRKVKATMKELCTWLLDDLRDNRQGGAEIVRPLIFIGHSMGGVVIAKMLCMAKAKQEYEALAICTMGCAFFGAPFGGTNMAKIALLYTSVFGSEAYESLLALMRKENNDALEEITDDFVDLSQKLTPNIELFCAYEQVPMDASYSERFLPALFQNTLFSTGARKILDYGLTSFGAGTFFVDKASAQLQGAHAVPITADHRDMVKFPSVQSPEFAAVRYQLKVMVKKATANARKRTAFLDQKLLTQKFVNQVRQSLEGVDMRMRFRTKAMQRSITSWLSEEPLYKSWLSTGGDNGLPGAYLWLKGGPGLGKTNACLAAIQHLHEARETADRGGPAVVQNENFLAFFLCEESAGFCTAEDLLKNLIVQIINQDESLAQHARLFVPDTRYLNSSPGMAPRTDEGPDTTAAKATATVDNLWKCLQDMMDDPIVNDIHVIVSNIHCLTPGNTTTDLLSKLRANASEIGNKPPAQRRMKWLITSRSYPYISNQLAAKSIAVIDLENDREYGVKVKDARQRHAREAVTRLASTKRYSSDLTFYIRNSIEGQSEDEKWIEIVCILLKAMPDSSTYLTVRRWLRDVGHYNMNRLIDDAWSRILLQNETARLELEELIQVLSIAHEDPTLADLAVICQIADLNHLAGLIRKSSPILQLADQGEYKGKVVFANTEIKDRLSAKCRGTPETSDLQIKRDHGLVALRCFEYIKATYLVSDQHGLPLNPAESPFRPHSSAEEGLDDPNALDPAKGRDNSAEGNTNASPTTASSCSYPTKYLFKHLSEASPDVVRDLFEHDPDFWGRQSPLLEAWSKDFQRLMSELKDIKTGGLSALHVAAGIGACEVVTVLLNKNKRSALSPLEWTNDDGMTALHVAAFNDRHGVVDVLIKEGADIEAGDGGAGTPLHFAALRGHRSIIALLIEKGANVNAFSPEGQHIGPVINAAIRSGTVDAVKQIMDGDVRFEFDYTKCDPPLSLAARFSEPKLFQDILETGKAKWLQNVKLLDQALIEATQSGRLESVSILLEFKHLYTSDTLETAVLSAAELKKWPIVNELLDYTTEATHSMGRKIKLDDVFFLASITREERMDTLVKIWKIGRSHIAREIVNFSLYQAILMRNDQTALWLLDTCGADPNTSSRRPSSINAEHTYVGITSDFYHPLNVAASTGNAVLVRALLQKKARTRGAGVYALQLAAREGHDKVVEMLLQQDQSIVDERVNDSDELNFSSGTALQTACENNRIAVVRSLLQHGADPNRGGGPLTNPLTAATRKNVPDVLRILLEVPGIDVNAVGGEDSSTPLINAAAHMSFDAVELLIRKDANIDAQNSSGDTALIVAAARGDKATVDLLCNEGADVTYRGSGRGLPIQVAAAGANPLCAHMLAERMGRAIEEYREQVAHDRESLRKRGNEIETLESRVAEKEEALEVACSEMESQRLQRLAVESDYTMQGQTYLSMNEQIKAISNDRAEIQRQLDTARGQLQLANDTVARMQKLLRDEQQKNGDLRKRHGYVALQEELQQAQEKADRLTQAVAQKTAEQEEATGKLRGEMDRLREAIVELEAGLEDGGRATKAAQAHAAAERRLREEMQAEKDAVEERRQDLADTLARMMAAAKVSEESRAAAPTVEGRRSIASNVSSDDGIAGEDSGGARARDEPPPSPAVTAKNTFRADQLPNGTYGGYRNRRRTRASRMAAGASVVSDS